MPSITTHHIFAKEVEKNLPKKIRETFREKNKIYETFAQSHDYLFYNLFHVKKAAHAREIGHYAHKHNTQGYFLEIIRYLLDNHLENNKQCVAYLYGSITHYVLDTTCHPFIFYKTGACNNDDPNTYKYRGLHTVMEKDIDALYYKKYTGKNYNLCNVTKEIIGKPKFKEELIRTINHAFKKTYKEENVANYFKQGIKEARFLYTFFINDRLGIKRFLYKGIDKITKHKFGYLSSYSTYNLNPNKDFLNLEHKKWNYPTKKEKISTESFDDLFQKSMKKATFLIKKIHKVLKKEEEISILYDIIEDLSYSNGLPLSEYTPMRYFEF